MCADNNFVPFGTLHGQCDRDFAVQQGTLDDIDIPVRTVKAL